MAVLVTALGVTLVFVAVPRTVAAWNSMNGGDVFAALALGRSPANERLDAAIAGLRLAVDEVPSGNRYYMLASVELDRYRRQPSGDLTRAGLLANAERNLKRALEANPADARASLTLAVVWTWQRVPAREVATALLHSMDQAPNLRELWLWRATYLLATWGVLTPDEAAAAHSQLRTIWRNAPPLRRPLLGAALAAGRANELAAALADEPESLAEFVKLRDAMAPKP